MNCTMYVWCPDSLATKIPALMGLGSVEQGLRKTQAAEPKEKKAFNLRWKKPFPLPSHSASAKF